MGQPKQLLPLGDRPIAAWSLAALAQAKAVTTIVIACELEQQAAFENLARTYGENKVQRIVAGGATRQASVFAALRACEAPSVVAIHDGARPLAKSTLVEDVVEQAQACGAAIAAIAVKDTIKLVDEARMVKSTVPRSHLWAAQTPQAFAYDLVYRAHEQAQAQGFVATDDAELVERLGASIAIVEASVENLKVTTPEDLRLAEYLVASRQGSRA